MGATGRGARRSGVDAPDIDARSGALLEHFGEDWLPLAGAEGRIVQPGHLFEWAWLLQRCGSERANTAALRLVRLDERHGVRGGVALNALLDDFSVHDAQARLWPQTERLKRAGAARGQRREYWAAVVESGRTLQRYLAVLPEGLWYDTLTVNGRFIAEPSPASTLYHLVAAIAQLGGALAAARGVLRRASAAMSGALATSTPRAGSRARRAAAHFQDGTGHDRGHDRHDHEDGEHFGRDETQIKADVEHDQLHQRAGVHEGPQYPAVQPVKSTQRAAQCTGTTLPRIAAARRDEKPLQVAAAGESEHVGPESGEGEEHRQEELPARTRPTCRCQAFTKLGY